VEEEEEEEEEDGVGTQAHSTAILFDTEIVQLYNVTKLLRSAFQS